MTPVVRRLAVLASVAALALPLAGCGGASSGGSTAGTPSAAGGSLAASVAGSAPATASDVAAGGDPKAFCGLVKKQLAALQGTEVSTLLAGGGPAAWKAYFDRTTAMNQQLVAAAPAQVRPSVVTLQATTLALRDTLAAADYDLSKVGSTKLLKTLGSKQRTDASAALTAYVATTCGIDLTKVGG